MEKFKIIIDDVPVEVAGIYHPEEIGGEQDEILPTAFEVVNYWIKPKDLDYLLAWHTKDEILEMIAEKALEEFDDCCK